MSFDFLDDMDVLSRPTITPKPWMSTKHFELVTKDTLPRVVDECIAAGMYALDLETTGLDMRVVNGRTNDQIVGACLSPDGERGYYIPVRHTNHMEHCVPVSIFEREMRRLVASKSIAIFHNGKFDQEFLQFGGGEPIGEWDDPRAWEDTLILAYLRDTLAKAKGLKFLSKSMLQMEMIELDELFTEEESDKTGMNFSVLDPTWQPCLWYAASDAICTYLLFHRLYNEAIQPFTKGGVNVPSQKTIYEIEKLCVAATRWMERNRIPIDRSIVEELIRLGQRDWLPALLEVYDEAAKILGRNIEPGYIKLLRDETSPFHFDPEIVGLTPNTTTRLGLVDMTLKGRLDAARAEADRKQMDPMRDHGKKRVVATLPKSVKSLVDEKLMETVEFPLVYDIQIPEQLGLLFRELGVEGLAVTDKSGQVKTSKGEIEKVLETAGEKYPFIGKIKRFREIAKALSSNLQPIYDDTYTDRSPDSSIRVNFDAFKVETGRFSTPTPREERDFTGTVRWNLHSIPAGYDTKKHPCMLRMREIIWAGMGTGPEGATLAAIDFSGQELRIATNFSNEPKWVTEFFRCGECGHEFDRGQTIPPPPEPPPTFCPTCGSDKIGDLHSLTAINVFGEEIKENKKEFKGARQKAKCVHPDTLIFWNGALVRIGSLPLGDVDSFIPVGGETYGPDGNTIPLLESYNGGVKPLFHVVTRRGIVTCSDKHPFQTTRGRRSIDDGLVVGMDVLEGHYGDGGVGKTKLNYHLPFTTSDFILAGQMLATARANGWRLEADYTDGHVTIRVADGLTSNRVLAIVPAGEGPCVDIHVGSEDHLFWCNGLSTSNSLNFAMCYGGGGSAAQRAVSCSKEEGWRIKAQFDKTYKGLAEWWRKQHEFARATGVVLSCYNRRIYLPDINHTDGFFRSKAERNATNGPIQSSGSDIMKFSMGMIYKEMKKRGWLQKVRMLITIHDELVFSIDNDILQEAILIIKDIMLRKSICKLPWRVPLTVDIECGRDWTVPWNLTKIELGKEELPEELAPYLTLSAKSIKTEVAQAMEDKVAVEPVSDKNVFVYSMLRKDLTEKFASALAKTLRTCKGNGNKNIRIELMDTHEVVWEDSNAQINEAEFRMTLDKEKLR